MNAVNNQQLPLSLFHEISLPYKWENMYTFNSNNRYMQLFVTLNHNIKCHFNVFWESKTKKEFCT